MTSEHHVTVLSGALMSRKAGAALGSGSKDGAKETGPRPSAERVDPASRRDQLAYLSDIAGELATMADRLGSSTLAGLLELARREAGLEAGRDR